MILNFFLIQSLYFDANLLTVNSSKTEFLIIGLKQQLSKLDNSSLNITHYVHNLVFINILPSLIRSHLRLRKIVVVTVVKSRTDNRGIW